MKILKNGIAVIEGDSHISKWVEAEGRLDHDQYSLPIILEWIPEGGMVVDGGAFIGDHTIAYLNKVGKNGLVYAFEPNREAYECLVHNCPNALCSPKGLSDEDSEMAHYPWENAGAGFLGKGNGTKVVKLDHMGLLELDFLKLDVEGMETRALLGAKRTIKKCRPVMWIEVNPHALDRAGSSEQELLSLIKEMGYEIQAYPPDSPLQYDVLCRPLTF